MKLTRTQYSQQWNYHIQHHSIYYLMDEYVASFVIEEQQSDYTLSSVYVNPIYQGKGYGKEIVMDALKQAMSLNYPNLYLMVKNDNHKAISLYKKVGFRFHSTDEDNWLFDWMKIEFKSKGDNSENKKLKKHYEN